MLSLSNVKMVQAANYYQKDDYYSRSSTEGDEWQGKLKKQYTTTDMVTPEAFNSALKSLPNPERAAIDLTFSAPKSVSIAMVLGEELKKDMIAAHDQAVKETLNEIEQNEIEARITKNGITERVHTDKMAAAKFNHFVSRNQDMQLHTHCVILNRTEYEGKSYAISNENLYENHIVFGQLYRNRLAKYLQKMGYRCEMTDNQKGFFELQDADQKTIEKFSSRRAEIVEKLKEWNANSAQAASKATLLTRQAKKTKDLKILERAWREQIGDLKIQKSDLVLKPAPEAKIDAFDRAVARMAENQFAFSVKDLERAALAEGCIHGMDRADVVRELNHSQLIKLGSVGNDKNVYYTTAENIEIEAEIRHKLESAPQIKPIAAAKAKLQTIAKTQNLTLSREQEQAVLHIAGNTNQYLAVQGLAGTGKTYMLNATRQLAEANGYTVRGMSFTGKAAEGLQNEAKIDSTTLHSFFNKLEKEAGHAPKAAAEIKKTWNFAGLTASVKPELWVVDEAGMTDNHLILHLQRAASLKGAKVVFVGDHQQLAPVGVGNAYSNFIQNGKLATCYLTDIRRQKDADLLSAVKEAVSGDIGQSLSLLSKNTREIKIQKKRFKAIAEEYGQLTPELQNQTLVLTAKNKDRVAINEKIRENLIKSGHLAQGEEIKIAVRGEEISRNFAANEKIIFLKNNHKLGVMNGQTSTIKMLGQNYMTVASNGKTYKINTAEYKDFDYGYCVTTHKAQGITVERAIINIDSSQKTFNTRNAYYVDVSRARSSVSIYTDDQNKIGKQVGEWTKKVTSENFLIQSLPKSAAKIERADKLAMTAMPMIPAPIIGSLLNMPIKVVELGAKVAMKAVKATLDLSAKMNQNSAQDTKMKQQREMRL